MGLDDLEVGISHWAAAPLDRNEVALFSPTLDGQRPRNAAGDGRGVGASRERTPERRASTGKKTSPVKPALVVSASTPKPPHASKKQRPEVITAVAVASSARVRKK